MGSVFPTDMGNLVFDFLMARYVQQIKCICWLFCILSFFDGVTRNPDNFLYFLDCRIIRLSGYSKSGQNLLRTNVSGLTVFVIFAVWEDVSAVKRYLDIFKYKKKRFLFKSYTLFVL